MKLRARHFEFSFPRPALVMGILNVTPDSFSDGGRFLDTETAVAHGVELVEQGAEVLDVGGESTRPRAVPVEQAEELRRVIPVIKALAGCIHVPISIDTMKPDVARAALDAGASIVNDVGANRTDTAMWKVAAQFGAGYVCMHMQGTPQTMQQNPSYQEVVSEVGAFFVERIRQLKDCGVASEQIIIDPGIGFGKSPEHNVELLSNLEAFGETQRPLLIGVSRKSFLGKVPGTGSAATPQGRLAAGLACACLAVEHGAAMVRAHDVAETLQAIRMTEAILAQRKV